MVNLVRAGTTWCLILFAACGVLTAGCDNTPDPAGSDSPPDNALYARSLELAKAQDHLLARVGLLSELGGAWAQVDSARAGVAFSKARAILLSLEAEPALALFREARAETRAGPAGAYERNLDLTRRTMTNARPVWAWVDLAEAWRPHDPDRAAEALSQAEGLADLETERPTRDRMGRQIALAWVRLDRPRAEKVAAAITAADVRADALAGLGTRLIGVEARRAEFLFGLAFETAMRIDDPAARAETVGRVAEAWAAMDPGSGERAWREAVKAAGRIKDRSRFAWTIAALAPGWGRRDESKAFDLAALLPVEQTEARLTLFLRLAEQPATPEQGRRALKAAEAELAGLKGPLSRDRVQARMLQILTRMAETGPSLGGGVPVWAEAQPGFPVQAGRAWLGVLDPADMVPRGRPGAPENTARIAGLARRLGDRAPRARALIRVAVESGTRGDETGRLLEEAEHLLGPDADATRTELALAWAVWDETKALRITQGIRDHLERIRSMARLAAEVAGRGRVAAGLDIFNQAVDTAQTTPDIDDLNRARSLMEAAREWAGVSPVQAGTVWEKAYHLVAE